MVYRILDFISRTASYLFLWSLLYMIPHYLFGFVFDRKNYTVFDIFYTFDVLFALASALFIAWLTFTGKLEVVSPWVKYFNKEQ